MSPSPSGAGALGAVALLSCWFVLFAGCAQAVRQPVEIAATNSAKATNSVDWSPLGLTLQRVVDGETVRRDPLRESQAELTRLFAQLAHVGPTSTPSQFQQRAECVSYWLNAHTAATLFSLALLAEDNNAPEQVPPGFDERFTFEVDGQFRSRAELAAAARNAAVEDWRIKLALPTVTEKGPPLPSRIYLPEMLDAQLDRAVRRAFASPRVVRVNHGEIKQIQLWPGLWRLRSRLISDYEASLNTTDATMLNVVLAWTETSFDRVTLNSAVGYAEVPMPQTRRVAWQSFEAADLIDAALGG